MNNSSYDLANDLSRNESPIESNQSQNQSLSAIEKNNSSSDNEIINLKNKLNYYEKHLSILLSKYQETTNKFIIFRDFFLQNQNQQSNDVKTVLEKMSTFQNAEENTHIESLIEENSQLHINFKRSTDLLKQQKEVIDKLKNSNKELNSVLEMVSNKELSNQHVEELEKENKDLQSLYEMMLQESDDLNAKNQTLNDQIDNYKSKEDKLLKEQKKLLQKIADIEDELLNFKLLNDSKNIIKGNKPALDISSSISFAISEPSQDEIQVRFPTDKSNCDNKSLIEELEVKSNYLESELDRTTGDLNKMIRQNDVLKQDHKKNWINLKNAKAAIDKYKEIETILREKLESAGIEIPNYEHPIFEEV